jgi:glycosyltransferase involved in cell wall biosynthesis
MFIGIEASHANKDKRTGVEEYCWRIIQELKKQIPSSVRVVLYSERPLANELGAMPANWEIKILPWPFSKGWSQVRLSLEFLFHPPDVFFAPGQLVPFICPKNTVATIHDSAFMVFPRAYGFFGRQYLKVMNRLVLKNSKIIITPSEFTRQELRRLYNYDVSRVKVVPHGYDKNIFKKMELAEEEKNNFLAKFNITKPFYLSVGRLEEKKNTANIVRAFDLIKKEVDAAMVLAGTPRRGFDEVKKAIDASPNRKDIITPGWVGSEDVAHLYNLAEAFIFPSLYEGFGLPVLDAMACGCPVIASKGNSLEEVGGDAAVYVSADKPREIAEKISKILSDRILRQKMSENGLVWVKNFSWEKTARLTWAVLSEAVK